MRNSDGYRWERGLRHEIVSFVTQCTWNAKSPTKPSVTQAILGRLEWNMTASISKVKSSIEKKTCCKI